MDETSPNARPKRRRVLRAADVIPPFDKDVEPAGDSHAPVERPERASAGPGDYSDGETGSLAVAVHAAHDAPETGTPPAAAVEVPTYDLAANILAEQRRVASRRRRAPGQTDDQPGAAPAEPRSRAAVVESMAQDLVELQQIVAEIVARDIERLCRRPSRALSA
jgi:hypothetical protein